MNSFFRKLRWLTQRSDKEAELREELQFHLEEEAEQRQEDGLAEDEARWAARRELGNLALVEEDTRAAWGWTRLEQLARDAGYGLRQVRRNPAFSAIAIATLALGIGGITAMFSAFDAVLIRPLPYADADRLVMIWDDMSKRRVVESSSRRPPNGWSGGAINTVFTDIAATQPGRCHTLRRFRARTGPGAQGDGESLERPRREAADRAGVHGRRRRERRAGGRHQPRTVAAALRRLARCIGPQDHRERQPVRSDRRHAARVLLHARARHRHLDAGFISRLDANELLVARRAGGRAAEARRDAGARARNRWRH